MRITEPVLRLLRSTKFQKWLNENDFDAMYAAVSAATIEGQSTGEFTQLLLKSGIDPLRYMKHVPEWFLCGTDIKSLNVPDNIESISDYAFYGCSSLESISIGNNVTHIGYIAFYGCYSLTNITIPSSIISISDMAFYSCKNLKEITYKSTARDWERIKKTGAFDSNIIVHCTDGEVI